MVETQEIERADYLAMRGLWTPPHYLCYALLAVTVLLFSFVRWRLRDMPLQRDEGEYAYAGQLLLRGIPPYQVAYNVKLPGTYAAYGAILWIFGQTPAGIHVGLLMLNAATGLLLFVIGLRLFEMPAAAFAGMSYLLLSSSRSVLGFQGHATHFVVFFALAAILLLLKALDKNSIWLLGTSGLLFGMAILMKQHGVFFLGFAVLYMLLREYRQRTGPRSMFWKSAALVLGAAFPLALTFLILWHWGVFAKFWLWTFHYAHTYTTTHTWAYARRIILTKARSVTHPLELIWMISLIGLSALWWDPGARSKADFILTLFFFSCLSVCPGFVFRGHYFILLLPATALLVGIAVSSSSRWLTAKAKVWPRAFPWIMVLPGVIFLLAYSFSIVRERNLLFEMDPVVASREFFGFPEGLAAGDFIRQHSTPDARMAVLGSEPEIYFYSHRLSATGYIYTYPLMEAQIYAPAMQREMIGEIENARPEFLVLIYSRDSWGRQVSTDETIFKWADSYLQQEYHLAATVSLPSNLHLIGHAEASTPVAPALIYILQRGKVDSPSLIPKLSDLPAFTDFK